MKTKAEIVKNFDPNGVGQQGTLFGLPFSPENAELIIIPVPFEVTVSYSAGTARGPVAIRDASTQVDLLDGDIYEAWKLGIAMLPLSPDLALESEKAREIASSYIAWLEAGEPEDMRSEMNDIPAEIDQLSVKMMDWVNETAREWREKGKLVAVLGGDHSTPLGLINALAEEHPDFGILQIDAHMDLRESYEGFEYSHASIMFNALKNKNISRLVQAGIRDYCDSEEAIVNESNGRIVTIYDRDIKEQLYEGNNWKSQCESIATHLPEKIYISFDIDGLDPKLCPHTGTPVPGGFEFAEAMYLIKTLVKAGKKIIGFDLCEVAPGEDDWDGNVGARALYKLCNLMAVSQGKLSFRP